MKFLNNKYFFTEWANLIIFDKEKEEEIYTQSKSKRRKNIHKIPELSKILYNFYFSFNQLLNP